MTETESKPTAARKAPSIRGVLLTFAALLSALALVQIASEARYDRCVQTASAKYPAIAVSAFTTKQTGPLKVSYDVERKQAVDACAGGFLFF